MTISVHGFCVNVMRGDYKEEVEAIRTEQNKDRRDKNKSTLPAATVSGTFEKRNKESLLINSGFICCDFDFKDNPDIDDWPALRDTLGSYDNVLFSALSVSGRGVFAIMPLAYPEKHEQHFDALKLDYQSIGLVIDKKCRNVDRLRGISYDKNAILNESAIPYQRLYVTKPQNASIPRYNNSNELTKLIQKIVSAGIDITNDYENWFEIGRALANEMGEAGRGYFHQISKFYKDYKVNATDKQYTACLRSPGKATKATVFELARQHGVMLYEKKLNT